MKTTSFLAGLLAATATVSAHATFQQLWVNGVDQAGTCVRAPTSNSPVDNVSSSDMRCGLGSAPVSGICTVPAGGTVSVEMHQQPNDRSCTNEAIGGNHDGPVIVYLSKVGDATKDAGDKWFKIYQNGLVKTDYWGTDVLNANCGKQELRIPSDIAPGDYLLRAEVIALHVAGGLNGAQFYISCYQIRVTGNGSANPSGVSFPGAYSATDPGILFNLYGSYTSYTVPGPAVYNGGGSTDAPSTPTTLSTIVRAPTSTPISSSTPPASTPTSTSKPSTPTTTSKPSVPTTTSKPSTPTTTSKPSTPTTTSKPSVPTTISKPSTPTTIYSPPSSTPSAAPAGSIQKWYQCGGQGWTGSGTCASGLTCTIQNPYYHQCL